MRSAGRLGRFVSICRVKGLPAPFGSFPRFVFGTSDSQAIRVFRSYKTAKSHEARWLLPRQPSRLAAGLDPSRGERTSIEFLCGSLHLPCLRSPIESLLRGRCKSVERSCSKHSSARSSKSRCVGLTSSESLLGCSHLFLVNAHLDIPGRACGRDPPKAPDRVP